MQTGRRTNRQKTIRQTEKQTYKHNQRNIGMTIKTDSWKKEEGQETGKKSLFTQKDEKC